VKGKSAEMTIDIEWPPFLLKGKVSGPISPGMTLCSPKSTPVAPNSIGINLYEICALLGTLTLTLTYYGWPGNHARKALAPPRRLNGPAAKASDGLKCVLCVVDQRDMRYEIWALPGAHTLTHLLRLTGGPCAQGPISTQTTHQKLISGLQPRHAMGWSLWYALLTNETFPLRFNSLYLRQSCPPVSHQDECYHHIRLPFTTYRAKNI
jgi:hypothetical protein